MANDTLMRFDRGEVRGSATRTDEGYIRAEAVVTRSGVFVYQNADGTTRRELRHPDDIFKKESLDSMKMVPVTNGHPKQALVDAVNAKELMVGSVGENVYVDGEYVIAPLNITHADAVGSVDSGRKELSLGYTVELVKEDGEYKGQPYTHRQRNIKYNHLAIVDRARAGGAARINLDSGDFIQTFEGEGNMADNLKTVTLDGLEYKAAPEVARALEKANKRADAAEKEKEDTGSESEKMKTDMEKLKAERDSLKEQLDELKNKKNDGEIEERVQSRIQLERIAHSVLDGETLKNISGMKEKEIKIAIIKAKFPKANLDEASDVYIQGRYDSAIEDVKPYDPNAIARQRIATHSKQDGKQQGVDLDKARADAFESITNAYKKGDE